MKAVKEVLKTDAATKDDKSPAAKGKEEATKDMGLDKKPEVPKDLGK